MFASLRLASLFTVVLALCAFAGPARAEQPETFQMNLHVGLESYEGQTVSAEMAFFVDPTATITLTEHPVDGAVIGVSKQWSGEYVANVDKDTSSHRHVAFQLHFFLSKSLSDRGEVSYFLSISQGHQSLVGLSAKSLAELKAVAISQLAGESIPFAEGPSRPLITIQ